ncbi:hypothetical protein PAECIP112173_00870 [Paenibacillus sp. JJ-100]|uniref:hypothetical protein n=1 Tax=Paenibacillus sp. JJ-100 TaxID=2974896 RepID=UPI0022FFB842|nr:hypothetical protein [Paenibacillus sp. JJ-100]CAI6037303.1 hypothetical protein PAECIP112173_00870 [Paenibacillus sp. JJ-100]
MMDKNRSAQQRKNEGTTEHERKLEQHEQQQTVDPIPMQDLNMEAKEEKLKDQTKSNSSTEEKYRADYRKRNE